MWRILVIFFLMGRAISQYITKQRARYKCFYLESMLMCSCVLEKKEKLIWFISIQVRDVSVRIVQQPNNLHLSTYSETSTKDVSISYNLVSICCLMISRSRHKCQGNLMLLCSNLPLSLLFLLVFLVVVTSAMPLIYIFAVSPKINLFHRTMLHAVYFVNCLLIETSWFGSYLAD